jgi:hypothetical protein
VAEFHLRSVTVAHPAVFDQTLPVGANSNGRKTPMRMPLRMLAFAVAFTGLGGFPCLAQEHPSPQEVKQIAEEGFVYGLPLVMNYAVMYQYSVDLVKCGPAGLRYAVVYKSIFRGYRCLWALGGH